MESWLESVYSDGTKYFVSNPLPKLAETVTVSIRFSEKSPVDYVYIRTAPNGTERLIPMERVFVNNGLVYYQAPLEINEKKVNYQFFLICKDIIYYYTQAGITTYIPDMTYDFRIVADYEQPQWAKGAVFYQIFPDRFCNGDPDNDVKDNEYEFNGHPSIQVKDWYQIPKEYPETFNLDFYGGDLEGVAERIPYLKELGVQAVYLNPIFRAPTCHKYDCIDYFEVDPHLGGDEALARLSKVLHDNGMKLILDISVNHTGTANRWFNKNGEFFPKSEGAYNNPNCKERNYYFFNSDNSYECWLGTETLPTLNYTSEELRGKIYRDPDSVLKKWLKPPYLIDGWRFDVADVMARNNKIQLAHEVWSEIHNSIKEENREAYILAENWDDCAEYLQGSEWDAPMNYFGFGRAVRQFFGESDLFHARNEHMNYVNYKMSAKDLEHRIMEHFSKIPYTLWQMQYNLLDSHDVPRLHNNQKISESAYTGAVIMLFTMPGATSIYYGDEVGIHGNIETVEGCRYPMPWSEGMSEHPHYRLYQKLAHLKTENDAFINGGFKILYANDYTFCYARFTDKQAFLTVVSTEEKEKEIAIPIWTLGIDYFNKTTDVLGSQLKCYCKQGMLYLKVRADRNYLIEL